MKELSAWIGTQPGVFGNALSSSLWLPFIDYFSNSCAFTHAFMLLETLKGEGVMMEKKKWSKTCFISQRRTTTVLTVMSVIWSFQISGRLKYLSPQWESKISTHLNLCSSFVIKHYNNISATQSHMHASVATALIYCAGIKYVQVYVQWQTL